MEIRRATYDDITEIERIYDTARKAMRRAGNHAQWIGGYPQRSLVEDDIARGACYLAEEAGEPHAVFMFAIEDDPTYAVIEDGAWLNDEPYGVIHRIGSDGAVHGVLASAVKFAARRCDNIRIDTHADNAVMRHALAKAGFRECGTVHCHDGSPRIAFQLSRD